MPGKTRSRIAVCVIVLCAWLAGCGGAPFTGTLTTNTASSGPVPGAGQAEITFISPSSIAAASAGFTLAVTGLNFTPSTVVMWGDSTPLTTTYISSTALQAQVPSSLVATTGTTTVVPSPVMTFNFGFPFTVTPAQLKGNTSFTVTQVPVQANDLIASATSSQLYVAVSSSDPSHANTITALDPQAGQLGTSVSVGGNPSKLAVSADGTYGYAVVPATSQVRRFTLPALQADITIPLAAGVSGASASDIQVQPTNARTIAVARTSLTGTAAAQGDVAIFDDGVVRGQTAISGTNLQIDELLWSPGGQGLYGFISGLGNVLYPMPVDSTGVHTVSVQTLSAFLDGSVHYDGTTNKIYSDSGKVFDPVTYDLTKFFPFSAVQSGYLGTPLMIPDGKLNIAYFLGRTIDGVGSGNYVIEAYDLTHFTLLGTASIPNVVGTPVKFVRWGTSGLAFLTTGASGDGVYVVSGTFVTSPGS